MSKRNRNRQPNSNVPARSGNNHPAVRVERRQSVTVSKSYSGPTPPPEVLAATIRSYQGAPKNLSINSSLRVRTAWQWKK